MTFLASGIAMFVGFFGELIIGWPNRIWHPIMGIGSLISLLEKLLRRACPKSKKGERAAGIVITILVPLISLILPLVILMGAYSLSTILGFIIESVLCWSIFATGSLRDACMDVYNALKNQGIDAGRKAVGMIVGRDTNELSKEGIIKATVETVAENLSDGVIAPMLFTFIGGAPLGFFYKAVNTMDSMLGYKNKKYMYFGTGPAKFDDFCNFVPARISAVLMIIVSKLCGLDSENAVRIFKRDRFNHASPNSAQTESVMAGALNVQLAGDASYFGTIHKKKTIGEPIRAIDIEDLPKSAKFMCCTCAISMAFFTAIKVAFSLLI